MTGLEHLSLNNQASQSTIPTRPFGHHSVTTSFGNTVTTTSPSFSRATSVRFTLPQYNADAFHSTPGATPTHFWDAVPHYSNSTARSWTAPDCFTASCSNAEVPNFTPNVSTNPWDPVSHQLKGVTHSSHSTPLGTQHTALSFPTVATTTHLPTSVPPVMTHPTISPQMSLPVTHMPDARFGTHFGIHHPVSPSNPTAAPATLVTPVVMTHPTTSPQVNLPVTHPLDTPIGTHVGFHHPLPLPSNQSTMLPSYTAADPTHVIPTLISPTIPQAPIIPQVRLPKLSIKKFNGDITKWVTFWDSYNSSIHSNSSLSDVDKFNYLVSLVESSAAEAIAGLTITAANYEEAIATLKKRFGNAQLIVSRHMDALLNVTTVSSHLDIRALRKLLDTVEAHIRGLRALGVSADSYGGLLSSLLVNKLPSEIRLIISRKATSGTLDLDGILKTLEQEVEARECASATRQPVPFRKPPVRTPTSNFLIGNSSTPSCVYCGGKNHTHNSCTAISDVNARKEHLRKAGRCYICLRKNHLSRDCRSTSNCRACRGRHHTSICLHRNSDQGKKLSNTPFTTQPLTVNTQSQATTTTTQATNTPTTTTTSMYVGAQNPVLLQTARMQVQHPSSSICSTATRAIMDSGSQRTYITRRLQDRLNLPVEGTESLQIKTFGATKTQNVTCDIVNLGVCVEDGEVMNLSALVVPSICKPLTSQPINYSRESYEHLIGLELADAESDMIEIDVLIGQIRTGTL